MESDIYLKITNEHENHHNYQYHDGLNILIEPFNHNINESCGPGGFYFTTKKYIFDYFDYGIYLREVRLPLSDSDFCMVTNLHRNKCRANKIILGERYSLFEPATYIKLRLDLNNFANREKVMRFATRYGSIQLLEWLCTTYHQICNPWVINIASFYGYIHVLDWWLKNGSPLNYNAYAMYYASIRNHIGVLDWWLKSGLELKYDKNAINDVLRENINPQISVWWENSGLQIS